jgi:hypothetical protein
MVRHVLRLVLFCQVAGRKEKGTRATKTSENTNGAEAVGDLWTCPPLCLARESREAVTEYDFRFPTSY